MSYGASYISLFFLSLGVMPRVPTTLHLHVARDDGITTQLANCNENDRFSLYPYSML